MPTTVIMWVRIAYELGWDVYTYLRRLYFESIVLPSLLHATREVTFLLDGVPGDFDNPEYEITETEYIIVMRGAKRRFRRGTRLQINIVDEIPLTQTDDETALWCIVMQYERSPF